MIKGEWFPPTEIDSDDEWTFLRPEGDDGLYASAWDDGRWEVGYDGPMGYPIESGKAADLDAAKQAAETALEGQTRT
jgi:hypothetical protein